MRPISTGTGPVLVTGAGGVAGVAVIRALAGRRPVVAADCDPTAVGLHLGTDHGVLPRGDDPDFAVQLAALAARTGATALVCTVAEEIPALHEGADLLAEVGLRTWLPPARAVAICTDRWTFARTCAAGGAPVPATEPGAIWARAVHAVPGPWIVKPRFERGSRHTYPVDSVAEARWALRRVPDPLVQTRLTGPEFTVDVLVDRSGRLAGAVPRWRLQTRAGISTRGRTFTCPALGCAVAHLLRTIGLRGPANVQGFMTAPDRFTFTEVDPRFSGGLPLSLAAGADFVGEYLRGLEGLPVRRERLVGRAGVTMLRHLSEVYPG
ncbi:ATP-grasp domain-containing protein [Pseudonocardia lacus]|uniref:ATP-grasp domain-containing protein n=1 Tax=Pseudonocardia lacus TaxID=2835865 RepID=UPI001BDD5A10|nr:ATP-grasp domain-containing protein [Pseudonocardia lacus]